MRCWLDRDTCQVCGVGAVAVGWSQDTALEFQGRRICAECLVPTVPHNAWRDWLLFYVYTPKTSFLEVLNDVFAEEFQRRSVIKHARQKPERRYTAAELVSAALDERTRSWVLPSVRG